MRTLLAVVLLFGFTACSSADEKKPAPDTAPKDAGKEPEKKKLGIGDAAPPLTVTKWFKGDPVTSFAPGKVYVLDFWATWCGPCIQSMPHMNEMHAEYKDKGLTVVAVTTKDPNNSAEAVEDFVKTRGAKYGFGFAYCDDRATDKAYMEAAGQDGIPCSFVVGKDGKVAFIGHPLELDDVLPRVIDGTWRGQADIEDIAKANKALDAILEKGEKKPDEALTELAEFAKTYPWKAASDAYAIRKVVLLLRAKKGDEAKAATEPLMKKYEEKKNVGGLGMIRNVWTSRDLNPDRLNVDVGLAAADAALAAETPLTAISLIQAAEAYFAAGKPEKAVELGERAVAASTSDRQKEALQKRVKKYKGEKDEDEKK